MTHVLVRVSQIASPSLVLLLLLCEQSESASQRTPGFVGVRQVLVSKSQNADEPHDGGGVQSAPTSTHTLVSGQHTYEHRGAYIHPVHT